MAQKPEIDLEAEIDRLYQLAVAEFVKARNELAKRVRASGDRAAASQIKSLAKPSVSAWAVNQLFWKATRDFEELLATGDRLRAAQQAAAGAAEVRAAGQARRKAIAALVRRAEKALVDNGHGVGSDVLRRIEKSLEAAASYGRRLPEPGPGRLTEDLEPPGFDALSAFAASLPSRQLAKKTALRAVPPPRVVPPEADVEAQRRKKIEEELAAAQRRAVSSRAEAKRFNQALEEADAAAADSKSEIERAERRLDEARRRAERAKSRAEEALARAKAADQAAAAAQKKVEEVRTALRGMIDKQSRSKRK